MWLCDVLDVGLRGKLKNHEAICFKPWRGAISHILNRRCLDMAMGQFS